MRASSSASSSAARAVRAGSSTATSRQCAARVEPSSSSADRPARADDVVDGERDVSVPRLGARRTWSSASVRRTRPRGASPPPAPAGRRGHGRLLGPCPTRQRQLHGAASGWPRRARRSPAAPVAQWERVTRPGQVVVDGLSGHRVAPEELGEDVVDESEDPRYGTKVGGQHDLFTDLVARPARTTRCRRGGTGRSTAWDPPPRTAHPAGRAQVVRPVHRRGDAGRQLDLDGIGVLELVDEQAPVAAPQGVGRGAVVSQQSPRMDEQVVKTQSSLGPPFVGRGHDEAGQPCPQLPEHGVGRGPQIEAGPLRRRAGGAHLVEMTSPVPLLSVPVGQWLLDRGTAASKARPRIPPAPGVPLSTPEVFEQFVVSSVHHRPNATAASMAPSTGFESAAGHVPGAGRIFSSFSSPPSSSLSQCRCRAQGDVD